jgi:hypothetical protein
MPRLQQAFISSLSPQQAGILDSVLKKTTSVYAGLERNHGESQASAGFNYTLIALGRYPIQQYKSALSLQKGITSNGRWLENKNQKISFPSAQTLLFTNADMQGFLDRYTFPENRPEQKNQEIHPIALVDSLGDDNPGAGLIAYFPNPTSAQIPFLSSEDASLPVKDISVLITETQIAESLELRFKFNSDNAARVYLSSVRMLSAGMKLGLSLSGTPSLARSGAMVSVTGLSASRKQVVNLLQSLLKTPG